ncbi:MAG: Crp/Fnr family transcriptional regulator [Chloroflexi bacterium]|nr:Crp/Fnr family transcriptional regulator [Chloroflexota bacterium]
MPSRIKKHDTIFFAGLRSKFVFLLHRGTVGLFRLWETGEESIVTILAPGNLFGLTALMNGKGQQPTVHLYEARALSDAVVCRVKKTSFEEQLASDSERALGVIRLLLERIRDLETLTSVPTSHRVQKRLVSLLLLLAERFGEETPSGVQISTVFSHQDIAYLVSSSRATITRELQSLRGKRLISVQGRFINIPDVEALSDLLD